MNFLLSIKKVIVLLIIIITISLSLNSEELTNKELNEKIKEAQAYFDDQELDKAIQILTEVVESNPDRLDQAVALMNKITEVRKEYNKKYRELITALFDDEDPDKALILIEEMAALEKNPNEAIKTQIRTARITAELVVNKVRLREIMDNAKIELDLKNYSSALVLYNSGFQLGRQTYQESELISEIEKNAVIRGIDEIYEGALTFLVSGQDLNNSIEALRSQIRTAPSIELADEINNLIELFNQYSSERDLYYTKSKLVDDNLDVIVSFDKNAPERFFLDFSKFLLYGRNDVEFYEGIISTTDLFWEDQFLSLSTMIDNLLVDSYNAAIIEYKRGNYKGSEEIFLNILNYAKYSISIYNALNKRLTINKSFSLDEYSSDLVQKYYGKLVDARILARVTDTYKKMINLNLGLGNYDLTGDQTLDDLYNLRVQIVTEIPIIEEEEILWDTINGSINWLEEYNALPEQSDDVYTLVKTDMSALKNKMNTMNLAILTRLTDQEYERITSTFESYNIVYENNQTLIDGVIDEEVVAYTGDDKLKSTFPDRALPNLEILLSDLDILTDDTQEIINTFRSGDIEITEGSSIEEFLNKAGLIIPQISNLSKRTENLEILSRDNLFLAEGFENQGSKLIENVRAIVSNPRAGRENFDRARENLKDANNAFYQSFSYKENLELRKQVDNQLEELQQALLDGENKLVVVDVRNFINQGKEAYINRQYGRSRVFFDRAQNRWFTTNSEDHLEILYWMDLVDLALQFDKGRTITKTEPLFDEMTQFLNLSYSNYNRGVNLIGRGERDSGLEALDRALANLENVTIFMPQNESASLLRLKIAQLRDPEEFRESFSIRIEDAWEKLQSNDKESQKEGYTELIDLSKIDADYPDLQNKISIAEFDILKTRRRPPNPEVIAESESLYVQAFRIVEGGVRSQYEVALEWLNQSIALNPNNEAAITLKDKIQVDTGGQATIVLPLALLNRFEEAQLEFENGNYAIAYGIIVELKKDGRSAKYPPLLQLEERVKLKLNI